MDLLKKALSFNRSTTHAYCAAVTQMVFYGAVRKNAGRGGSKVAASEGKSMLVEAAA